VRKSWLALSAAALFAGTCDIAFATGFSYLRRGVPPRRVLQFVASGALGPQAFEGGLRTAALGLALHYLNAFIIAAAFFAIAAVRPALVRRPLIVGVLYGAAVFWVMNFIVIPWSRIGPRPARPAVVVVPELLVHMFLIGYPIAVAARASLVRGRQ
jgi:hypothetical protein